MSQDNARPAVLFDIDGTLVDTNYFHAVAWCRAFRQAGHQVAMSDVHHHVGMGSDRLLDALLPDRDRSQDDVLQAGHSEHYASYYGVMQPFHDARRLLERLAERGAKVVLATSASPKELAALRSALDIEDALAAVTSSKDASGSKPEPDILEAAMQQADVDADHAIMVGDTVWDAEAAANAGMPCVGVLTGGIDRAKLTDAGMVAVYEDAAQLLRELDSSPVGELLARYGL